MEHFLGCDPREEAKYPGRGMFEHVHEQIQVDSKHTFERNQCEDAVQVQCNLSRKSEGWE